jgi:hypothetical protein
MDQLDHLDVLEEKMYAWCADYLPQDAAEELSKGCAYEARQHSKGRVFLGIAIGVFSTLLLIKWLA